MENLIGKKYIKVSQEVLIINAVEIIDGKQIVFSTDGKSYYLDELILSDMDVSPSEMDDLKEYLMFLTEDEGLQKAFNSKFNKDFNLDYMMGMIEGESRKMKSFKIFGWRITFSKSK